MSRTFFVLKLMLTLLLLQACSGNGFHLRESVALTPQNKLIYLQNLPAENEFSDVFEAVLEEAGGALVETATEASSVIDFRSYEQGRRVVAYTSDRRAREYLLFLKFAYSISDSVTAHNKKRLEKLPKRRVNIDRTYLYDPDFALGKAEEEKQVIKTLYEEAARLILLRLKYAK